jgi:hypothetical protein
MTPDIGRRPFENILVRTGPRNTDFCPASTIFFPVFSPDFGHHSASKEILKGQSQILTVSNAYSSPVIAIFQLDAPSNVEFLPNPLCANLSGP